MRIITNPTSRRGRGEKLSRVITKALDGRGIPYTLEITSQSEHATLLAEKAVNSGEDLVLCIGGDGTVSEVAAGLKNSGAALGIIPAGTGNDFAKYLGIPKNPMAALDIAISGSTKSIDLGLANDRTFINAAGCGLDVAVLKYTLEYKKVFHGLSAYIFGVLRAISSRTQMKIKLEYDDVTVEQTSLFVSVSNGRYFGGGMCVSPFADASDGLFDVIYVDELARFKIPFMLASFIKGRHMGWPIVHHFRCSELTVTTSDASLQLDGEIHSAGTVRYKILPGALKVKVP